MRKRLRSIMPTLLLSSLQLGGEPLDRMEMDSSPDTGAKHPLGVRLLARFRATLDFPNRELLLERPADYDRRVHIAGYTGIWPELHRCS